MKRYEQLTLEERYQISALLRLGWSKARIARSMGRASSTIVRELLRNSVEFEKRNARNGRYDKVKEYRPTAAQKLADKRRVDKGCGDRKIQGSLRQLVEQKLFLGWSPEQICGRLWDECRIRISHETIYQHVLRDTHEKRGPLRYCLRFGGYKQHRFKKSKLAARTRARKNWLDTRPAAANNRSELGHWERDCMLGQRGGAALLTMVDRKSRFVVVRRVERLETRYVGDATLDGLKAQTVTIVNVQEFGRDEPLQERLQFPIYFCDPSSPWQRGSIENTNGLIRQYIPKGTNVDRVQPWMLRGLEETLNFRPRKTLGFRTPHEVHFNSRVELMRGPLMRLGLEFSHTT